MHKSDPYIFSPDIHFGFYIKCGRIENGDFKKQKKLFQSDELREN